MATLAALWRLLALGLYSCAVATLSFGTIQLRCGDFSCTVATLSFGTIQLHCGCQPHDEGYQSHVTLNEAGTPRYPEHREPTPKRRGSDKSWARSESFSEKKEEKNPVKFLYAVGQNRRWAVNSLKRTERNCLVVCARQRLWLALKAITPPPTPHIHTHILPAGLRLSGPSIVTSPCTKRSAVTARRH